MLSNDEKREMLEDGKNKIRRDDFRFSKGKIANGISFDDYLIFLNNIQEIFSPFKISHKPTFTKINKL